MIISWYQLVRIEEKLEYLAQSINWLSNVAKTKVKTKKVLHVLYISLFFIGLLFIGQMDQKYPSLNMRYSCLELIHEVSYL